MSVVVSSWVGARPVPRSKLIEKVCRLYGFDTADADLNQAALDMLDETINDINMSLYDFNLTSESSIPLTEGNPYVTLTTGLYRENLAYLVDNNGRSYEPMDHIPWPFYQRWYGDATVTGTPERYSAFNPDYDGRLYIAPTPDAAAASNYTMTVEYYARIPLVSEISGGASLEVPREVESALVYGAQKRIAMHLGKNQDVGVLASLESEALNRLKRVDKTRPDRRRQFVLRDFARQNRSRTSSTDVYIKI